MFTFLFGFLMGGVTGAAIVLAMAPNYQYQEDGEEEDVRAKVADLTEQVRATVKLAVEEGKASLREAVDEGKVAAAEKTVELREMVKKYQDQQEEEDKA